MTETGARWLRRCAISAGLLLLIVLTVHQLVSVRMAQRLGHAAERLESLYGPLSPASLVPPHVADHENRTPLIRAAIESVTLVQKKPRREESVLLRRIASLDRAALESRTEEVRAIVERNEIALELLRRASERAESNWNIAYYAGAGASSPPIVGLIDLGRLVAASAMLAVHEGRTGDAAEAISVGLAASSSLAQEPTAAVQLGRYGINRGMLGVLRELLATADPAPEELERVAREIALADRPEATLLGYVGEMKMFHHMFETLDLGSSPGDDSLMGHNAFVRWLARPFVRSDHDYFLRVQERTLEYVALPRHERVRRFGEGSPFDESPPKWRVFAGQYAPNLATVVLRGDLDGARFALARTALALRRYRTAAGAYPESLQALVPAYLDALPIDPFAGEPPAYERRGAGFELRSPGAEQRGPERPESTDLLCVWSIPR